MTWLVDDRTVDTAALQATPDRVADGDLAAQLREVACGMASAAHSPGYRFAGAMAEAAAVLWSSFHRFDAADPHWPDRDRFVLSPGYGAPLLYALLHLTGHDGMDRQALSAHRQLGSPCGGHPDAGAHPGIEATTGPLGQGLGIAVGMALAERLLAARFGKSLVDHRTWVLATAGDVAQGVSHEAAWLAGSLRLDKLCIVLEQGGGESGEGSAGCDDAMRRFAALGWATRTVDANDRSAIHAALSLSSRARRPTLIACDTSGAGTGARRPAAASGLWCEAGRRGSTARRVWLKRLAHHPLRAEFDRVMAGRLPEGWAERLGAVKASLATDRSAASTRSWAERLLEGLTPGVPELIGGQTQGSGRRGAVVSPGSFSRRHVHYGPREHGMAACLNGLALHRGVLPYGVAPLAATDGMRPALRLSAMMGLRVVYVATHDSIGLGADGAAFQPAEQLAGLRALPNLLVLRPADAVETAECCELAVRRSAGPSVLVLSEQPVPALRTDTAENRSARGAYVLAEANGPRAATLIASGSEVSLALAARERLMGEGIAAAVVSMPAWSLFAAADAATRAQVLGPAPRFGIEAACGFGWERWLGEDGVFLGLPGFGASAPAGDLFREFGLTVEDVAIAVCRRLEQPARPLPPYNPLRSPC